MTIASACDLLTELGCAHDTFYRHTEKAHHKPRTISTPAKVAGMQGWYNGACWHSACVNSANTMGPIEFLGGPPHRWGIHRGSLLSLVIDRIAVLMLLEGAMGLDSIVSLEKYLPKGA